MVSPVMAGDDKRPLGSELVLGTGKSQTHFHTPSERAAPLDSRTSRPYIN